MNMYDVCNCNSNIMHDVKNGPMNMHDVCNSYLNSIHVRYGPII